MVCPYSLRKSVSIVESSLTIYIKHSYKKKRREKNNNRVMKDEVKMDANRLIAEVYKRPALWNQRHISYHNREVTNHVWMEIAAIFKLPKPILKAKWKGLRDTFRAELKKDQVYRKTKFHSKRPVWIHYKSLQFLKEQMLPRPPIWERPTRQERENHERNCRENEVDTSISQKANSESEQMLDEKDILSDHLRVEKKLNNGEERINVKQEPEENFENLEFHTVSDNLSDSEMMLQNISPEQVLMSSEGESSNTNLTIDPLESSRIDDNYYFLMSLLPHMRTLSAERRMFLRMQIQELVYKEVYKKKSDDTSIP